MAFQKSAYDNHQAFLIGLRDFATSVGWSVGYDKLTDDGWWQMGLSKENCHISIGLLLSGYDPPSAPSGFDFRRDRTDEINGGTILDHLFVMSLNPSANWQYPYYCGNPGQLSKNYRDTESEKVILLNDLVGPFPNVWFFSTATGDSLHCVFQRGERYVTFSFGNVAPRGMTSARVGYCAGNYYRWWPNQSSATSYSYQPNDPKNIYHRWFPLGNSLQIFVPDKVLNPAYGWNPVRDFITTKVNRMLDLRRDTFFRENDSNSGNVNILDFFHSLTNQTTTGGVPLHSFPVTYTDDGKRCWLGELPDIRLVNLTNLSPAQEITYGADTWMVFPWRQKGLQENTQEGSEPLAAPNTMFYGVAIKKVV